MKDIVTIKNWIVVLRTFRCKNDGSYFIRNILWHGWEKDFLHRITYSYNFSSNFNSFCDTLRALLSSSVSDNDYKNCKFYFIFNVLRAISFNLLDVFIQNVKYWKYTTSFKSKTFLYQIESMQRCTFIIFFIYLLHDNYIKRSFSNFVHRYKVLSSRNQQHTFDFSGAIIKLHRGSKIDFFSMQSWRVI